LTIVVLLILGLVWAAVLTPSLLRRKFERRSNDSIGEFHQHLRVLRRTGPVVVAPAFRLMTSLPDDPPCPAARPVPSSGPGLMLIRPDARAPRAQRAASGTQRPESFFTPQACKRRRDVLASLACVIFGTGVLGAIPMLRPLLGVTLLAFVVSCIYVMMILRLGGRATERAAKLRYLPEPVEDEPSIVIRRAAR
jgi:hypothetical protein